MKKSLAATLVFAAALVVAIPVISKAEGEQERNSPQNYREYYDEPMDYTPGYDDYSLSDRLQFLRQEYDGFRIRFLLAGELAVQETVIGIRTDQKDAWRTYTQAVLAVVPEKELVRSLLGSADEDAKGPQAFARAEWLADALVDYGAKAEELKRAITDLRTKLSPEQLEAARIPRLVRG